MKISVVTPLYKSAPYVELLYQRCVESILSIEEAAYEIVFVNDASPDNGLTVAKRIAADDSNVIVVDLARNYGQHRAIMVGLENASGDLVFVVDCDLEDEPEWIIQFHEEMVRSGCDVVYGVQTHKKRGWAYRFGRNVFFRAMRVLSGAKFRENTVSARLMSRRFVDAVLQFKEREMFIEGIWDMCGFSHMPVNVAKYDRSPTTYTLPRLVSMAINGITSFSTRPLIGIAAIGVAMCMVAFAYTAIIATQKLVYGSPVEGWSSIMAAILVIGGLTILCNGIMAVYLAKIFIEVKQRPAAIIKEIYQAKEQKDPMRESRVATRKSDAWSGSSSANLDHPEHHEPASVKQLDA
jgi:putative glycosyltransferase